MTPERISENIPPVQRASFIQRLASGIRGLFRRRR